MLLAVSACEDETAPEPKLAIEAWIDSGGYPMVLLTRSLSPTSSETAVSEAVIRWAKVSISDGTDTVNMIGGMDYSVFPPFSYRTYAMRGEVGRTYTIEAEYEGMRVSATSTILPPPVIDAVDFKHVSDSVFGGIVAFTTPVDSDMSMYVLFTRVRNAETRHYPSFLGTVCAHTSGERCEVPLYRGRHVDNMGGYQPDFVLGDTVDVIVARVEPDVYGFWQSYQDQVYFSNKVFLPAAVSLPGNVTGGYGIFSARGVARREVVVL